jgi:hypothetical protein
VGLGLGVKLHWHAVPVCAPCQGNLTHYQLAFVNTTGTGNSAPLVLIPGPGLGNRLVT